MLTELRCINFSILAGALANLERAVLDYVFDRVCVLGFKPVSVPDLVAKEVTEACGVSQRTQKDMQVYLFFFFARSDFAISILVLGTRRTGCRSFWYCRDGDLSSFKEQDL